LRAIIGLGNPGKRYFLTRHNIGFLFLDYLQSRLNIPFSPGKGDYFFCETTMSGLPVMLVKPTTYMNLSGIAVVQLLEKFPIDITDILIVYDDFHLPFGELRFRSKGSSGGHNGINSIISELQSEKFARLKIGIGSNFENSVEFVLSKFSKLEKRELEPLMQYAYDAVNIWLNEDIDTAMNKFNRNVLDSDNTN
jgi:PTH1 family peptidyl-tRNA hydrolase